MLTKPFWPVIDYVMHYDYIVSNLCENKENRELECNGKCYLSKQLAKEAGDEDKNPFSKSSKTEIPQFVISETIPSYNFSEAPIHSSQDNFGYSPDLYFPLFCLQILQPPQFG